MDARPIGVFDSGIGGLSVLRNMRALMPEETFVYYGDNKNAPYGTRPEAEILRLAQADVDFLMAQNVKAIVIACNTATSAAAQTLRETMDIPIIGMEPALKPASMMRREGIIAVLATPATLRQRKYQLLMERYGDHAVPIPCAGLMEFAERGEVEGPRLEAFLSRMFMPYRGVKIDAAVLGCTHYVFLRDAIAGVMKDVPLVDGNEGTARQLQRVLTENHLLNEGGKGEIRLFTSGNQEELLPLMNRLLQTKV